MALSCSGQAFIFNKFFQPSVRFNAEYAYDLGLNSNHDQISVGRSNMNFVIPIKSKLGLKMNWMELLKVRKLGDLRKVARVKAYQIFWNIRPQITTLQYIPRTNTQTVWPFENKDFHITYGLSTGITGLHALRRLKVLFYSFNISIDEDLNSIRKPHPTFTGVIGVARPLGLFTYLYYGGYLSYSNGSVLPAPFIGIQTKIAKRLWLNITLPVQARLGWVISKKVQLDLVAGLNSVGSGYGVASTGQNTSVIERYNFSEVRFRTALTWNFKLGKQTRLYLETGFLPYRRFSLGERFWIFGKQSPYPVPAPKVAPTVYGGVSLFYAFKKSFLSSMIDGLIIF